MRLNGFLAMADSDRIRGDRLSQITGSLWSAGREPFGHPKLAKKKGP